MTGSLLDAIDREEPGLRIWRTCHAGFLLKYRDTVIVLDPAMEIGDGPDPLVSEHPRALRLVKRLPVLARELGPVDMVLISHADEDHCGARSVQELGPKTQVFVGPPETTSVLRGLGVPYSRIRRAYFGESIYFGDVTVTPTEAEHHQPYGGSCGYYIETPAGSAWHPGDTPVLPAHYEKSPPDVLLLPIAHHVFGPEKGADIADRLNIEHVIPTHYGVYDSGGFAFGDVGELRRNLREPDRRLHVLELGDMIRLGPDGVSLDRGGEPA